MEAGCQVYVIILVLDLNFTFMVVDALKTYLVAMTVRGRSRQTCSNKITCTTSGLQLWADGNCSLRSAHLARDNGTTPGTWQQHHIPSSCYTGSSGNPSSKVLPNGPNGNSIYFIKTSAEWVLTWNFLAFFKLNWESREALGLNYRQRIRFLTLPSLGKCQVWCDAEGSAAEPAAQVPFSPKATRKIRYVSSSDTNQNGRTKGEEAWRDGGPTHTLSGPASTHTAAANYSHVDT